MKSEQLKQWQAAEVDDFNERFLAWYYQHQRHLPWRGTKNPYFIWISEIMLQQTRVETVIGYYYRFIEKYPTIEALAQADEQELLKVWEGLGYYSRARNLKVAAQQVMANFEGHFPQTLADIQTLKGIGPYTSGAIASIAFGLPEPAIDGNLMRVGSRLLGIDADIAKASSRKVFDAGFREILSTDLPGDMNQAFMDLGSSICTPTSPDCANCPLKDFCYAYQTKTQVNYPVKTKKQPPKDVYYVAGVIENQEKEFLIIQRPEKGLLAKMWHFPLEEVSKERFLAYQTQYSKEAVQGTLDFVAEDAPFDIFENYPVTWQKRHLKEVKHVFSHLRWHVLLFYGRTHAPLTVETSRWVREADFETLVFPTIQQKLVKQWTQNHKVQKDL
ncbi:A/G-specific adenine glycosylase [Enterococcus sp. LJL98]